MATFDTQPVKVNEAEIERLIALYKRAYTKVVSEIVDATGFAVYQRQQILSNIRSILEELGEDISQFTEENLTEHYKMGAREAVRQLKDTGVEVKVASGFNQIHKAAIAVLVSDTQEAFGESMTGIYRSARQLLGRAVRDQITQRLAEGPITGDTLREVKKSIVGDLRERGLASLVDKGGKRWELDRYAEMLIRTKDVEARNRGLANRMAENDYDLVQVSNHRSTDPTCSIWEGKVLSLTGNTKGYPTVALAEREGLFHPNCKHSINVVIPELANDIKAYQ